MISSIVFFFLPVADDLAASCGVLPETISSMRSLPTGEATGASLPAEDPGPSNIMSSISKISTGASLSTTGGSACTGCGVGAACDGAAGGVGAATGGVGAATGGVATGAEPGILGGILRMPFTGVAAG